MKFSGLLKLMPALAAALLVSACGKAKFAKQDFQATAVAGQYVVTQPKIDIIVFQDNSDSVAYQKLAQLKPQLHSFLTGMSSEWDVHFVVLPLLTQQGSLSNKYVVASDCSTVQNVLGCFSPSQANLFNSQSNDYAWLNNKTFNGNSDRGFTNMMNNLQSSSLTSSGFLRPDAALAVVVVSDGNDWENVTSYDSDGDGYPESYLYNYHLAPYTSFRSYFSGLKGASILSKFYSVVSNGGYSNCYGSASFDGARYRKMSDELGSRSYNLCSGELQSVMASLRQQLKTVAEAVQFNYVAMEHKPMVSSIVVKKNGVTIPESSVNGWQYVGYMANQPTSFYPTSGNNRSGYMIRLNGSAVYKGTDQISVNFQKE